MKLLVLNPGSTSTKLAVYEDERELFRKNIRHSLEELDQFKTLMDQLEFRFGLVMDFLREADCALDSLDCVISRGGSPPNVSAGATAVSDRLIQALRERAKDAHPASLGPIIAGRIAQKAGVPAYIYDPISVDELFPAAKVSGIKGIEHDGMGHMLNTHAMGIKAAREIGRPFESLNLILVHIGGGNTVCLWSKGHPIDVISSDGGPFSAERCGSLRASMLVSLCRQYGCEKVDSWLNGKGGFVSLLGTNDLQEVERMIAEGDEYALLCQQALSYQFSKSIISLFPAVDGAVDGIVFTGGGANWKRLLDDICARLRFLQTPVYIFPGENEMQALAAGALRVLRGEERAHVYTG